MWYRLARAALFQLDPELAHRISLQGLQLAYQVGLLRAKSLPQNPVTVMGLNFPNRIGLAAGLDKNGDYIDALAALGFGFIEIGTVTPKAQSGNLKPRLFRLTRDKAIINRMGFNNHGIEYVIKRLEAKSYQGILGVNIGKNAATDMKDAIDDYLAGFRAFWPYANYITINISSPNTNHLRDLQNEKALQALIATLKMEQAKIHASEHKYVPLVVKIAPDLSEQEIESIAKVFLAEAIDGVIATNTTLARDNLISKESNETGGLSGAPLREKSNQVLALLQASLAKRIPIIASGGVMNKADVIAKQAAGAELVQVYTGLIYEGPSLIKRLCRVGC